jgi:thymidine phosphorylase
MVHALGGPADFIENFTKHLPRAATTYAVLAKKSGYVTRVNTFELGNAIVELGGGRRTMTDKLDLSVGLSEVVALGEHLEYDQPLAIIHAPSTQSAEAAADLVRNAYELTDAKPTTQQVIYKTLSLD